MRALSNRGCSVKCQLLLSRLPQENRGILARLRAYETHPLTKGRDLHYKQVFFVALSRCQEARLLDGAVGCMAGVRVVYAVRLASAAS